MIVYNARLFYNLTSGEIYRCQIITLGTPLSLEEDIIITANLFDVSVNDISYFEWDNPDNIIETLIAENKIIKVDNSQTPPVLYGEEPEIIEPSDDDEIGGREFLNMVEGVL